MCVFFLTDVYSKIYANLCHACQERKSLKNMNASVAYIFYFFVVPICTYADQILIPYLRRPISQWIKIVIFI